jgi:hypothetical protein
MEYAARLTRFPSRQSIVVPLVALVLGAGIATGAYALIDDGNTATASKVIVVEQPGPHAADIAGKNEAGTAAAISKQQGDLQLRGSKASDTGTSSGTAADRAQQLREDPHGPAISLRNP